MHYSIKIETQSPIPVSLRVKRGEVGISAFNPKRSDRESPCIHGVMISFSSIILVARPRSSMDRVTDFESGGCAFDPRRGYTILERYSLLMLSVFAGGHIANASAGNTSEAETT